MKNFLLLTVCLVSLNAFSQVVTEDTKRKFTIGVDVYADIWQDIPQGIDPKTINPGVNIFGSYNYMFGNSNVSFSPGIGLGIHNLFSDSWLRVNTDSAWFEPLPDTLSYKKSKLTMTYLDIPLELRFKSKSEFRVAVGFKFGFLLKAQTKYKGQNYIEGIPDEVIIKTARFDFIEGNRFGFTGRIGYKWLNLYGYYQLSTLFQSGRGPEMYPFSVGLTLIPF
jgi:hypothetical protein